MRLSESTFPGKAVSSYSLHTDGEHVETVLGQLLEALADAKATAIIILGPSVTSNEGTREVLAVHTTNEPNAVTSAATALASSDDFLAWDGPLVAWQDLAAWSATSAWRERLSSSGWKSFVRVAMELSGNRFFEVYTFTEKAITNRVEAALLAWATSSVWPRIRRALAARRLKLSPREIECLGYVCYGLTSREISEKMNVTERTATHFITALSTKFCTSGRSALPQRASWLGLLEPG